MLREEGAMRIGAVSLALTGLLVAVPAWAVEGQIGEGRRLYSLNCVGCHGKAGEGTKRGPALVGATALPLDSPLGAKLRKTQFVTAKDVLDFASAHMPFKKPGSLPADQYAAIMAFLLKENGVDMDKKKLDASTASTILLRK
jgi:mono/diheme cytochrome c family protein